MPNSRSRFKPIQGALNRHQGDHEYQALQNLIEDETGVKCSVLVTPNVISIATKDYPDYVLARMVLRQRTSRDIVRKEPAV